MASASQTCWPSAHPMGCPNFFTSACVIGDAKYSVTIPSIISQPPSPQGDASVPISTIVPTRLYASTLKYLSIEAPLPVKNARDHRVYVSICFDQMQLGDLACKSSGVRAECAAHTGSMNGLSTMSRPAACPIFPSSDNTSFLEVMFWARILRRSVRMSSIMDCFTRARTPCCSTSMVPQSKCLFQ